MRRLLRPSDNESHEPTPLLPGELAVGRAWGVGQVWAYDHDCWKARSNRRRGPIVSLVGLVVERRLLPCIKLFMYSLGFGRVLGVVIYRARYGLLWPLPGGD